MSRRGTKVIGARAILVVMRNCLFYFSCSSNFVCMISSCSFSTIYIYGGNPRGQVGTQTPMFGQLLHAVLAELLINMHRYPAVVQSKSVLQDDPFGHDNPPVVLNPLTGSKQMSGLPFFAGSKMEIGNVSCVVLGRLIRKAFK